MMRLALFEDRLAGALLRLPPAVRGLYLRQGSVRVNGAALAEDDAVLVRGAITLDGQGEIWRFEVADLAAPSLPGERAGLILAHTLPRDPAAPFVLRLDRVDFPPDAETPRHGHAGPGIRRLLGGRLLAEIGTQTHRVEPGGAWYETGEDPVIGRVLVPDTAFIRCMVLDATLLGQPTFRAWDAEQAARPRGAAYRLFFDTVTALDAA